MKRKIFLRIAAAALALTMCASVAMASTSVNSKKYKLSDLIKIKPTKIEAEQTAPADEPDVEAEPTEEPAVEIPAIEAEPSEEPAEEPAEKPAVPAPAPAEAPAPAYSYERGEDGALLLDEIGNPVVNIPDGMEVPVKWLRDDNGALVLDENGEPIPTEFLPAGSQLIFTDVDEKERVVEVYYSYDTPYLYIGSKVTLYSVLTGFEGDTYTLQWQYSMDEVDWVDADGANDTTFTYELNEETNDRAWRMSVTVEDEA